MIARGMSVGVGDQHVVLGDRHRDAGDVGFLEGIGADQRAGLLPGDRDHRDRVHVRVGDRGDEVRRARTRRRHADADLAGGLRVPGGRVPRALLVADEHVPHPRGVQQRVVGGKDRAAGNAEHDLAADLLQRADERLGAGHRHGVEPRCGQVRGPVGDGLRAGRPAPAAAPVSVRDRGVAVVICGSASLRSGVQNMKKPPTAGYGRNEGGASTTEGSLRRGRACEVREPGWSTWGDGSRREPESQLRGTRVPDRGTAEVARNALPARSPGPRRVRRACRRDDGHRPRSWAPPRRHGSPP